MREVDPDVRDAARGMGLSGRQLVRRVELPLAVPYLAAGFRTAAVQVVATATLAAFVNGGGLGMIISRGFGLGLAAGGGQILAGGAHRHRALPGPRGRCSRWSNGWYAARTCARREPRAAAAPPTRCPRPATIGRSVTVTQIVIRQ